jgi:hypothetical protein
MAPEFQPGVVIFDARFDGDSLRGTLQYVESPDPNHRLRVRWSVGSQPKDYLSIGGGVAYVYEKVGQIRVIPISEDASPLRLGNSRYLWTEGLQPGQASLMFILILPEGFTLFDPHPYPVGTKVFGNRLALYWILKGDDEDRGKVELTIKKLQKDLDSEIVEINKRYLSTKVPAHSTVTVEDQKSGNVPETRNMSLQLWIAVFFLFILVVFLIVAFFTRPVAQFTILRFLSSLCGGCAAWFISGDVFLKMSGQMSGGKYAISGTAGCALFLVVWFFFPHGS